MNYISQGWGSEDRNLQDMLEELIVEIARAGLLQPDNHPPVPSGSEKGESERGGRIISLEDSDSESVAFEETNDFSVTPKTTYSDMRMDAQPT